MTTSRAMKACSSPWLGDIPIEWTESRFRYEAELNGGQVDPRVQPWSAMRLIAPNHIESHTGRLLGVETAEEQGADSGKYLVSAGQLVYSKIRPALNKVAIAPDDCLCSADMYAMSFRDSVDPRYAQYYMLARPFHSFASVLSMRVKMPKVNRNELADAPWLLPPVPEQQQIADYLDRETAQIDTLIEAQERLVATLREQRQSVADRGVFGLNYPGTRTILVIGRHHAVEPLLASAPRHWSVQRFKSVATRIEERNATLSFPMMSLKSTGEVVPRSSLGERQEPDEASLPRYLVARPGNLIVNPMWLIGGAIGVSQVEGAVSPDYRVFHLSSELHPRYVHHLLRSRPYVDQYLLYTRAQTTFDRRVQQVDLDNLPMPVPPTTEQMQIADEIDDQTARIDTLIAEAEQFIELSRERRSSLITAAVTGQIDVRDEVA